MAVVDSGSPISMIRGNQIPIHARSPITERDGNFYGINNSRVNILGKFKDIVKVQDLVEPLCFFVVTENTMSSMALLGRDFTSRSHIRTSMEDKNLSFQRKLVNENNVGINKNEDNIINAVNEIMRIDYDKPCSIVDSLKINQELDYGIYEKCKKISETEYVCKWGSDPLEAEPEMNITLKHNQPISYRPRRLAFSEVEKLPKIIDEGVKNKLMRPSNSRYASPIVLVRKKDGSIRLCADYRELNKITVKDNFPTPLIDDHLDKLKNKRLY